jgi:Fe2+ or Zn2+ uptake regulation protein
MNRIEMIKEAISDSGLYSNNQCKIVNVLLDIAVNNVAQATVRFLEEKTGVKKPTIYFALKIFQKDGLIIKNEQLGGFEIQQPKLNYFLESYQKKQSV